MVSPELAREIAPLEAFEAIRREAMRLGPRLCDLSYANPHPAMQQHALEAVRAALDEPAADLQYTPFGGHTRVRRVVADGLRASSGLPFGFEDVVLTPGATAALHLALRVAGEPGDEVIVPTPCWLDYPLYVRALGLRPVLVPLAAPSFDPDPRAIARAITPRTCAILMSDPANPTGRVYSRQSLAAVAGVLARSERRFGRTITWIADEAHRDFVDPAQFHSAAHSWPATLIVYSYGKYHFLQGQRTGYLAVSPRHPRREGTAADVVRWSRISGFGAPTALMQRALPLLESLRHDLGELATWRRRYWTRLTEAGYRVVNPDATFFLYVAIPSGLDDFDFVADLARARVLALPAPVFHHRGYVRLSLTAPAEALERALRILCQDMAAAA